jgi:hypothetical protein
VPATTEPQVRKLRKLALDPAEYKRRVASERDFSELVTKSTVVYDKDAEAISIVYLELDDDFSGVVEALRSIQTKSAGRTGGMVSNSRIFGYSPRITLRRDYCSSASLAYDNPEAHSRICSLASMVSRYYQAWHPELYAEHQRVVEKVLPGWRLEGSVFTSGIINRDNQLPYHHDAGNFRNVWSNMLAFKRKVGGGYLAVPEYDLGFQIRDHSLLMFDGQNILHGVTPILKWAADSYRYTIVFYSLRGMWQCLTPEEETQRYRRKRTEREVRRAESKPDPEAQAEILRVRAIERMARRGNE